MTSFSFGHRNWRLAGSIANMWRARPTVVHDMDLCWRKWCVSTANSTQLCPPSSALCLSPPRGLKLPTATCQLTMSCFQLKGTSPINKELKILPTTKALDRERERTSGMQEQGSVSTDTQSDIFSAASPAEDGVSLRGANLQTPDGGRTRTVYDY
ncbi:hypothetical protein C0Q70_13368 [Pomacea canaliculata]|uniref:Uncharacterized protein n=1 Tax=Pomacea canaliculata TaxID=400727 RepID=A0A2T7NX12_POMCA|nr:hypothetical protein C0Q70_13368 [Pomacea canaliculata]